MKSLKSAETLTNIEFYTCRVLDLLEISKNYCETNIEESEKFAHISTLINIITNEQKALISMLTNIL